MTGNREGCRESKRRDAEAAEVSRSAFSAPLRFNMPAESRKDSKLDREAASHEAFARNRAGVYIGRQEYFDRLDAHVTGDGAPLVVLGETCTTGKSGGRR